MGCRPESYDLISADVCCRTETHDLVSAHLGRRPKPQVYDLVLVDLGRRPEAYDSFQLIWAVGSARSLQYGQAWPSLAVDVPPQVPSVKYRPRYNLALQLAVIALALHSRYTLGVITCSGPRCSLVVT